MAFQRVPDTVAITLVFEQNDENVVNTVHAERLGGYDLGQVQALANTIDNAVGAHIRPEMVQDVNYLRTEVRGLNSINDFFDVDGTNGGQGALLGPGLPNNVTLSIKRASGQTGRSARGRVYFVGLAASELETNENIIDAVAVVNKVLAWDEIRGAIVLGGWLPVIVSRFTGGAQRAEGVTFPWLSTAAVDGNVDSQRGRLA